MAWTAIEGIFASQSCARLISTRMALATASKGASTISEYFTKMKSLADDMASAGRRLEDEELVSYILTGLDLDFDPMVSAVAARVDPIFVGELYTQLFSFEQRMELHGRGLVLREHGRLRWSWWRQLAWPRWFWPRWWWRWTQPQGRAWFRRWTRSGRIVF